MSRLGDRLEEFVRRGQSAQRSADEILIREKIDRALMERGGKALFRGMEASFGSARHIDSEKVRHRRTKACVDLGSVPDA